MISLSTSQMNSLFKPIHSAFSCTVSNFQSTHHKLHHNTIHVNIVMSNLNISITVMNIGLLSSKIDISEFGLPVRHTIPGCALRIWML